MVGLASELLGRVEELGFELVGHGLQTKRLRAGAEAQAAAEQASRFSTTGVNPVRGSISVPNSMQPLGQASIHRPQALQNWGITKGFGRDLGVGFRHIDPFQIYFSPHIEQWVSSSGRRRVKPSENAHLRMPETGVLANTR